MCEAFYPALNAIEITLRNRLYEVGAVRYPPDTYRDIPCWLDRDPSMLGKREAITVATTIRKMRDKGMPVDADQLIASLTFGFWTNLFDSWYERRQTLWPHLLSAAFPNIARRYRTRRYIASRFNRIRHLRNVVFHHGAIWHWKNLSQSHHDVVEALGWLDQNCVLVLEDVDRFNELHQLGHRAEKSTFSQSNAI